MIRRKLGRALCTVVTSSILAACGGGGGLAPVARSVPAVAVAPSAAGATPTDVRWGAATIAKATDLGPVHFAKMSLHVGLKLKDEAGLERYARDASDPKSATYRQFLTPREIGARFGASDADVAAVATYFQSNGIAVAGWPQRLTVDVLGTQAQLERAFGTTFHQYQLGKDTFVAPKGSVRLAAALPIVNVGGLTHVRSTRSFLERISSASTGGLSAKQIARAYDYTGAYEAGLDGSGIEVGIIGTGAISPRDVPAIAGAYGGRYATVKTIAAQPQPISSTNGQTGTAVFDPSPTGLATPPEASYHPCPGISIFPSSVCVAEDFEAQLDTQQVALLAPGSTVDYYLAYNTQDCVAFGAPNPCSGVLGIALTDDSIQQAIADDKADIISASYGYVDGELDAILSGALDPSGRGPLASELAALAAEGIAVFFASGDNGVGQCIDRQTGLFYGIPCVSYPATDPSVVAVGGTNTPVDLNGNLTGPITGWGIQTAVGPILTNGAGSGGGISALFAAPPWQQGLSAPGVAPLEHRAIPDVALNADALSGVAVWLYGGEIRAPVGGTSAAAPDMAALWALVLQACAQSSSCATASGTRAYRLGNPAPLLYAIYGARNGAVPTSGFVPQLPYETVFYDVVFGSNSGYNPYFPGFVIQGYDAGPGFDLITGIGAPFAGHLVQAVTGKIVR